MKLTTKEKDLIIKSAVEAGGKALLHAFRLCKLEDKIESMIINDDDNEEYVLSFYPSSKFSMNRTEEYFKSNSGKIVINGKEYTQEELSDILSTTKSKRRKQLLGQIYQQKARVKKKQALCERYEREMDQYGRDLKSLQRELRILKTEILKVWNEDGDNGEIQLKTPIAWHRILRLVEEDENSGS